MSPPVLKLPNRATADQPAKDLLMYILCTTHMASTALLVERKEEGHEQAVQYKVYFINEVMGPSKIRYHYFDDHKVIVVTGFPNLGHTVQPGGSGKNN